MTLAELKTALDTLHVPIAYNTFRERQTPPYIAFLVVDYEQMYGDNSNYDQRPVVQVELYSENKDLTLEGSVETLLKNNGLTWDKDDGYLSSERLYMTTWEFTL